MKKGLMFFLMDILLTCILLMSGIGMLFVAAEEAVSEETVIMDGYETSLNVSGEYDIPVCEYKRSEDGNLILDDKGNPIAIVAEGQEIPITFQRDENGALVLDENGDPIPTQTVPYDATIINKIEDVLNSDRTIEIYYSWNNQQPVLGGEVTFVAVLYGYDNLEYTIQWQQSINDVDWEDVPNANELRYSDIITRENYKNYWRVQITITGLND